MKHQIYEVREWEFNYVGGTKYFSVYYEDGRTGLKYVYPNLSLIHI